MGYDVSEDIYEETLEYHGSTTIERIVRLAGTILKRKWLLFDTVEEAQAYFNAFGGSMA